LFLLSTNETTALPEGGFHGTGIDTMMADSGISKRTLYKYFSSKEDLIEAVLDYYGAGIVHELFDPVMAVSTDYRQRIIAFFDIRKAMIEENPIRGHIISGSLAAVPGVWRQRAFRLGESGGFGASEPGRCQARCRGSASRKTKRETLITAPAP
jgi:AcrR family transcriptional regulator